MSDTDSARAGADVRVDSLVRRILGSINYRGNEDNEDLASIARSILDDLDVANARIKELEAMCEWLAGRATMIERELGKQPTWDSSDDWLKAASEAVSK